MITSSESIIVSGSGGFLGSAIVSILRANGINVLVVKSGDQSNGLTLMNMDDPEHLHVLSGSKFDTWIHCGWWGVAGDHRNDSRQLTINIPTALKTVLLAHQVGCKHWIGIGSQAEFGPINRAISEEDQKCATTVYGWAKTLVAEQSQSLCESLGMTWSWVRVFSMYGPGDSTNWLIPSVINNFLRGESPALTLCEQYWDYLYIDDAAEAIIKIAIEHAAGDFNLGSGTAICLRELVERIRYMMASDVELQFGKIQYRPDQVFHLQADISKLVTKVKWRPVVSLDQGLVNTISYFRSDR
jgi:UDP-glucose 4-epimerase